VVLKRGDIVSMQTAGGGGFGAPPSGAQGSS